MWCSLDDTCEQFTLREEETLIKEVAKNRILYDPHDKDYKNNVKRDVVWNRIADKLKKSSQACRKRWKGTRDNYYKSKRYVGSRKLNRRRNPIFAHLTFLETTQDEASKIRRAKNMEASEVVTTSYESFDTVSEESEEQEEDPLHVDTPLLPRKIAPPPRKKTKMSVSQKLLAQFQKTAKERNSLLSLMRAPPDPRIEEDDVDAFFKGLAVTVKRFPPYLRAEIKAKLFAEVSNFEMTYFRPPSASVSVDVPSPESQSLLSIPDSEPAEFKT